MTAKLTKSNQSVAKVIQIIELMASQKEPMRLQDIALQADIPASTALRMLNTLNIYGYVNQSEENLKYSLSLKFAQLGNLVCSQVSIRDIAKPLLLELCERCGESSCLAVEQDMQVAYIDVAESPNSMLSLMKRIGKSAPMHCTGVGKVLLLNYDSKQIDHLISTKGLSAFTTNTIVTKQALLEELETIAGQGFAYDNEECEIDARCIAAPVRDYSGKVIAGISVSGLKSQLSQQRLEVIRPVILEIADRISKLMGYAGDDKGMKDFGNISDSIE